MRSLGKGRHWLQKSKKLIVWFITSVVLLLLCVYLFKGKIETILNTSSSVTIPEGLGVNIHFAGKQSDIDMIRDAGFNMVRTDLFWSVIEKKQGVYDFKSDGYDTLTKELMKEDIRPYYVLDYSNTLYEKSGSAIVTEKGREAFNRYVEKATSRYKNKGIIWEIWNEPNTDSWMPKPNIKEYALLLKQTSKTIKENDPSGIVVAPALAGLSEESLKWLEELLKKNALDDVDAISVHPYRSWEPESVSYDYQSLRALIKRYSSKPIPIISGEWGYSTANGWYGLHLSEEQQAAYLVRMFLINKLNKIPISIWYDWGNDGNDPNNGEHNFGLRQENTDIPKLAYHAMNAFSYMLSDYQFVNKMATSNPDDYVFKFVNEEKDTVFVMWTSKGKHEISPRLTNVKGQIMTMFGKKKEYFDSDTKPSIEISEQPIYLIIEGEGND